MTIVSKPSSKEYRSNWDGVFKKQEQPDLFDKERVHTLKIPPCKECGKWCSCKEESDDPTHIG
jgi:hypothetical protein